MKRLILAAGLAAFCATPAPAQINIVILTGSTSGVYYPLGNALSSIFIKSIPGARSSVQVTQGSIENLRLLEAGDGELAFSLGDTVSAAWKGNADAGFGAPLTKLRGVAAIYHNYIQLVVSEASGVEDTGRSQGQARFCGSQAVRYRTQRACHLRCGRHDLCRLRPHRLSAVRPISQDD